MKPHQQRVVDEKAELDARLTKLSAFIGSPEFKNIVTDELERSRLVRQHDIMQEYSSILAWRIAAFT